MQRSGRKLVSMHDYNVMIVIIGEGFGISITSSDEPTKFGNCTIKILKICVVALEAPDNLTL